MVSLSSHVGLSEPTSGTTSLVPSPTTGSLHTVSVPPTTESPQSVSVPPTTESPQSVSGMSPKGILNYNFSEFNK